MSHNDKPLPIAEVGLAVNVGADGVWLGVFPEHGLPAIINIEALAHMDHLSAEARSALAAWAAERRVQADGR